VNKGLHISKRPTGMDMCVMSRCLAHAIFEGIIHIMGLKLIATIFQYSLVPRQSQSWKHKII